MIRSMISEGNFHDKYVLGVKIGRGAFGQVRVVTKVSTGPLHRDEEPTDPKHERAVKILDLRDEDKPEELSAKLQKAAHKEATVWKAIGSHPNCIRLHDLFFGDDCCYMVMEKCNSGLLQSLASMPELNCFAILLNCCRCLKRVSSIVANFGCILPYVFPKSPTPSAFFCKEKVRQLPVVSRAIEQPPIYIYIYI